MNHQIELSEAIKLEMATKSAYEAAQRNRERLQKIANKPITQKQKANIEMDILADTLSQKRFKTASK
jgi:hypothetical protein